MHILINALAAKFGGGLTYLVNLIPEIGLLDKKNHYTIIISKSLDLDLPPNIKQIVVNIHSVQLRIFYEQLILPFYIKKLKVNILYSPHDMTTLLAPCRTILAMRNPCLYTQLHQEWGMKDTIRIKILSRLAKLSAWRADCILFVSKDSKNWISSNLGLDHTKLRWVHHGIKIPNTQGNTIPGKIGSKYLLSVSSIYYYKNYVRLVEAYAKLLEEHGTEEDLIIIGKELDKPYSSKLRTTITSLGLQGRVKLLGNIPYREIFHYYKNASLFVFPSYLETFGHPLLESMAMGVPVVASDIGVFREICADAAMYFDPFNSKDIGEKLLTTLKNSQLQEIMRQRGLERVKTFSWKKTAQETLKVFEELGNCYSKSR